MYLGRDGEREENPTMAKSYKLEVVVESHDYTRLTGKLYIKDK